MKFLISCGFLAGKQVEKHKLRIYPYVKLDLTKCISLLNDCQFKWAILSFWGLNQLNVQYH